MVERRIRQAKFPAVKSLDSFDFKAIPSLNKMMVLELAPSAYDSGDGHRSQGISKAGNRLARVAMVEAAWLWLRHQPDSALSQWFHDRTQGQKGRIRRIMIVALARKLAIALWRYLETGLIPEGAVVK